MSLLANIASLFDPTTVLIFAITLLFMVYLKGALFRGNMPPGPIPLPVVGNLPQVAKIKKFYSTYVEWSKV